MRRRSLHLPIALLLMASALAAAQVSRGVTPPEAKGRVHALKITVLSTMLADVGIGEWGFAALVEADGNRILFDTGARPATVLENARELGIDLTKVKEVILSHNHFDHTGGLLTLRRDLMRKDVTAMSRVHVGQGIFYSRPGQKGAETNPMIALKKEYEATGGSIVEHDKPEQIFPGVWLTGPVPRVYPERNWSGSDRVKTPEGVVEDNIPEDQSLIFDTDRGLVLLAGCGHAGIINTVQYARQTVRPAPLHAAIGGFHLFRADDQTLAWTAGKLREFGLENLVGAHCTGLHSVYYFRDHLGLPRRACVVGAVGATFALDKGIDPGQLAQ
jgi:7,8-dihydropterin-6-yl-methyl-4-(beta-D-ribofuranosyl)aminobenzene 5'-phosphate synthase